MSLKRKTGENFISLEITIENLSNGSNHPNTAQYFILTICYRILLGSLRIDNFFTTPPLVHVIDLRCRPVEI